MKRTIVFSLLLSVFLLPAALLAHCEIPCGIYNDQMRIEMLNEDITTIEKSMNQINELSAAGDKNYNQLVRWINNKETHADKLQHIVTQYFMTQRIKLTDKADAAKYAKYQHELTLLHQMLVYAMKSKQTTDLANVEKLRALVKEFADSYFTAEQKKHMQEHHK